MKRTIILGLLGGVLLFVLNAVSWMALPWHAQSLKNIPASENEVDAFLAGLPESGVYHYPGLPEDGSIESVIERSKAGPVITSLVVRKEGIDPLSPAKFGTTLLIDIATALTVVLLLRRLAPALPTVASRFSFVLALAAFVSLAAHGKSWLWWSYPTDFALLPILDTLVAWAIVGFVFATKLEPRAQRVPASELAVA